MSGYPKVLYVSSTPDTQSHKYRVLHHVEALNAAGAEASWISLEQAATLGPADADVAILFRQPWNDQAARFHASCRQTGTPIGFDIDDLIFDPAVMSPKNFDYLRTMGEEWSRNWIAGTVEGSRRTLTSCDFATVSTEPLAAAAEALGTPAYVVPNGPNQAMIDRRVVRCAPDGRIRLGYASGTPTHQKDFGVVAGLLAELLDERRELALVVVGHIDLDEFPALARHSGRIERRAWVPHSELLEEYARFDINLAPLEISNPFCKGKSELKFFEAALAEVPTVASATPPYRAAIEDGHNGYCAGTTEEWRAGLLALIGEQSVRAAIGHTARADAITLFGPVAQGRKGLQVMRTVAERFAR